MRADGSTIWMVGRAVTDPVSTPPTKGSAGDRVTFRLLSTERRFDDSNHTWVDGDEFGVNVVCWRNVGAGVARTVRRGDPVVVNGRLATRRFERNGATEYFTELKADVVGLDLARARHQIIRTDGGAGTGGDPSVSGPSPAGPVDEATDDPWTQRPEPALVAAG